MKKNVTQLEKEAKIILNHYQAGDYVIAENKAKKLLKENTNYLFLYNILGLSLSKQEKYDEAIYFFRNPLFEILTIVIFFVGFFHAKISLNEIFEDYINNQKIKDVANILTLILSIIIPVIILVLLIYKI